MNISWPPHGPLGAWWPYVSVNGMEFQLTRGDNSNLQKHGADTSGRRSFSCSDKLVRLHAALFLWFSHLLAKQGGYLLLHCLRRSSWISHVTWRASSPSKVRGKRRGHSRSHIHTCTQELWSSYLTLSLSPYQQSPMATVTVTSRDRQSCVTALSIHLVHNKKNTRGLQSKTAKGISMKESDNCELALIVKITWRKKRRKVCQWRTSSALAKTRVTLHSMFDWALVINQGLLCPNQSWMLIVSMCSECVYVLSLSTGSCWPSSLWCCVRKSKSKHPPAGEKGTSVNMVRHDFLSFYSPPSPSPNPSLLFSVSFL